MDVDKAIQTMIENLQKNTGKTLEEWVSMVQSRNFAKHGEIMKFLKEEMGLTHGFANLIAHKSKGSDAGSAESKDDLVEKQYAGKEHFKPVYEKLMAIVSGFGNDIEIAPKMAYVSLRRKKQFAMFQPATKSRFEIGLILKGQSAEGKLEEVKQANAMFSHKINIANIGEIDSEVENWLRKAYETAG